MARIVDLSMPIEDHFRWPVERAQAGDLAAGDIAIAAAFPAEFAGAYKVDTRYTDFFGRNATCAVDSILVRV